MLQPVYKLKINQSLIHNLPNNQEVMDDAITDQQCSVGRKNYSIIFHSHLRRGKIMTKNNKFSSYYHFHLEFIFYFPFSLSRELK